MQLFAYYIFNVILCSGLLYSYYVIALRNKKFHQYNRFYLLLTVALSIIIPMLKIEFWNETAQQHSLIKLLAVISQTENYAEQVTLKERSIWDWESIASGFFSVVSAMLLFTLVSNLAKIFLHINSYPKKLWNNICFVFSNTKGTPYSFFKYIFWNNQIDINTNEGKHILQHELAHVHQKHSADKLFLNIVLVAGWTNPFFWLIQKELNIIHEFIADEKAIFDGDTDAFASMLLTAAYPQHSSMLTNSFFYSPVKRRLLMLTTSKLASYSYLRRLMILPLLLIVTILFAFKMKEKVTGKKIDKIFAAIADAGNEKNIDDRTAAILEKDKKAEEKNIAQALQDTGLKKNKRQVEIEKGAKITITGSDGSVTEISPDASKPMDTTKNSRLLVVLDGEQMSWKEFGEKNIQPEQIMQMTVLKNMHATDKYGEKGQFGVIEITTLSSKVTGADAKPEETGDREKYALEKTLQQQSLQLYKQQQLKQQQSLQLNKQQQLEQQKSLQLYRQAQQKLLRDQQQMKKGQSSSQQLEQQQSQQLYQQAQQTLLQEQLKKADNGQQNFNKVFTKAEQPAQFPGGEAAWKRYLERNLNTKVAAPKGVYTVHVQFIVNEDGSIRDVSAEVPKDCQECGKEAIQLIKKGPKWQPAVQNGRTVVYQMVKEINFNVE